MKKRNNYSRVMIAGTVYSLFLYLLISTKEEIEDTFFFLSYNIKKITGDRLDSFAVYSSRYTRWFKSVTRIYIRLTRLIRWPFLRDAQIFGQDHLYYVTSLVGRRGMTIIEDGTTNYKQEIGKARKKAWIKNILYGERISQPRFGASAWDKRVILTGLGDIPEAIKGKEEIIDVKALWGAKSPEFREWVLELYGTKKSSFDRLKSRRSLLLVQALECHKIPEKIVIEVYRKLLEGVDEEDLVIKPHPSSRIDYAKHFPRAYIFKDPLPMEIISLMGVEFKDAYTISSTAIFSLAKSTNIHFSGTSIHPDVDRTIGSVEYSDFVK